MRKCPCCYWHALFYLIRDGYRSSFMGWRFFVCLCVFEDMRVCVDILVLFYFPLFSFFFFYSKVILLFIVRNSSWLLYNLNMRLSDIIKNHRSIPHCALNRTHSNGNCLLLHSHILSTVPFIPKAITETNDILLLMYANV